MSNTMKNWSKDTLLKWVENLSDYDQNKKDQIMNGIEQYKATGDDVWDADKDDLKEALNIDGLLAKKLAKSIAAQRNKDLGPNIPGTSDSTTSAETPFTLNIGGSTPTKLTKIVSTMQIGEIKRRYLEEHGHAITNKKMKGVNIKYLGSALADESRTLKSYGILNGDGFSLFITYSLDGGMSANDDEKAKYDKPDRSVFFEIGQNIKCIDKEFRHYGYYPSTVEAVHTGESITIKWGAPYSHKTDIIPKNEWRERIEGFDSMTAMTSNICQSTEDSDGYSCVTNNTVTDEERVNDGSNYDSLSMNEWKGIHTQCWINSLGHPFVNYADKFNKINGLELIDFSNEDLTVIITSKMLRKKLIKHLDSAKLKYNNEENRTINTKNKHSNGCVIGLNNLGNTCFLNTCIQLLSHTPRLSNYFAKRAKLLPITDNDTENSGFSLSSLNPLNYLPNRNNISSHISMLDAWMGLCDKMYNHQSKRSFSPSAIISALHQIDNHFGSGAQDDSARALRLILGKLDEEIENEIFANKKGTQQRIMNISEMNRYIINHSNPLSVEEEAMVIQELLRRHNPNDTIIRKLFDGVQREVIECLHCNGKFRQYTIFRDLDVPVVNNHVTFNNVNIVHNNKHFLMNCQALIHCTIDVLKYEVIQSLNCKNVSLSDVEIVTIPRRFPKTIKSMDSMTKISELSSFSEGSIFAVIHKNDDQKEENTENKSNILEFVLFIDRNGEISSKFDTQYTNRNVCEFISNELKKYDNKYDYQFIFNGVNIDISKLEKYNFERMSDSDCNSLIMLCIDKKNKDFPFYESDKTSVSSARNAKREYPNLSLFNALQKHKSDILNDNDSVLAQILGRPFKNVQKDSKLQLQNIEQTLLQLKKQQKLNGLISVWFHKRFASKSSATHKLNNLVDCLSTYQEKHILDRNSYEHTCTYCKVQCKLIQMERTIVYAPSILMFHLDRFNSKNNVSPIKTYNSKTRFKRNDKVRVFDKRWYDAKIIQTKADKVKISYDGLSNKYDEWIDKSDYSTRIGRRSQKSNGMHSSNSTKFRHSVEYKMEICLGGTEFEHNLFGIANHSGSTSEYGHYTATVKSSKNGCWYNISDSHISDFGVNALGSTKTATIIMYSNIQ